MQRGLRDKLRRIRILHCISDSEKLRAVVIVLWRSKDLFSIVAALPTARTVATRATKGYSATLSYFSAS